MKSLILALLASASILTASTTTSFATDGVDPAPFQPGGLKTGYLIPGPVYQPPTSREFTVTGYRIPGPTNKDPYTGRWIDDPLDPKECLRNGTDTVPYPSCWGSSTGGGGE